MARIVIVVEGGLVHEVLSDEPVEVLLKDFDVEGAEDTETMIDRHGDRCAAWRFMSIDDKPTPEAVEAEFAHFEKVQR